tara:strand:- start:1120 stop:1611 length:492 start_codon:yes stop_codon:yes gene_type:complete
MPNERKDVRLPMWRKKMDASMFDHRSTFVPHWVVDTVFGLRDTFPHSSKKDPRSLVEIEYRHPDRRITMHQGWVTTTRYEKGRGDVIRLFFDEGVFENLKDDFRMTYLRAMEKRHRGWNSPTAEREIPFWEFLDIEYDSRECSFVFVPHYNLPPEGLERFTHL